VVYVDRLDRIGWMQGRDAAGCLLSYDFDHCRQTLTDLAAEVLVGEGVGVVGEDEHVG
jgi:hypothetical protein